MKVAAWNNGAFQPPGAGYGLRLKPVDRDQYFNRLWKEVILDLPNGPTSLRVKLSATFWRDCPELRSTAIGRWLIAAGHRRWTSGKPPAFLFTVI